MIAARLQACYVSRLQSSFRDIHLQSMTLRADSSQTKRNVLIHLIKAQKAIRLQNLQKSLHFWKKYCRKWTILSKVVKAKTRKTKSKALA